MDYAYTFWSTGGALILAFSELGHEMKVTILSEAKDTNL